VQPKGITRAWKTWSPPLPCSPNAETLFQWGSQALFSLMRSRKDLKFWRQLKIHDQPFPSHFRSEKCGPDSAWHWLQGSPSSFAQVNRGPFQLEAVCIPATSSSPRKPATPSMVWPCKSHWFRTSRASPTCRLRWDAKWRWPTPKLLASLWLNCGLGDGWATAFCKWGRTNCSPYKSSRIRIPLLYKINYKMVLMTNLRELLWLQELH
jgi:hypothetical protein